MHQDSSTTLGGDSTNTAVQLAVQGMPVSVTALAAQGMPASVTAVETQGAGSAGTTLCDYNNMYGSLQHTLI